MNRRRVIALMAIAPLALWACSKSPPLKELTVDDVQTRIAKNDGNTYVYDCNDADMYKAGHVPGAKWVEHSTVPASELPSDKSATLIFYCSHEL